MICRIARKCDSPPLRRKSISSRQELQGAIRLKPSSLDFFQMPKPKKGEIYATYNNDYCYEKGLASLRKMEPDIDVQILDYHTIKILLRKKGSKFEDQVKSVVQSTKGYVEVELETINALKVPKKKEAQSDVLDTPFYG
jgi:hypothetical protein